MDGWYAPVGVIGLRRKPASKEHHCQDWCHDDDGLPLRRQREVLGINVNPGEDRRVIPFGVRHRCGSHCTPTDPPTPVRLGGKDSPVSFGLEFLSPASRDLLARLRARA